jgi:hypothetical protein
MEKVICCPEDYYGTTFSKFIDNEMRADKNNWIYDIIKSGILSRQEQVFIDCKEWCLCVDKHHGHDLRYLVIFKDRNLKTIRDLRQCHLILLHEVYDTVSAWLKSRHKHKYYMYFHYMPSVFQLHLHVNSNVQHINWDRAHLMNTVTANLHKDSQYYAKALIMTKMCKTIRSANAHIKLKTKLPSVWMHYNQTGICHSTLPNYSTFNQSTHSIRGKQLTSCLIR